MNTGEVVDGSIIRECEDVRCERSLVAKSQSVKVAAPQQGRASCSPVSSQRSLSQASSSQTQFILTASQGLTAPTNSQVLAMPPVSLGTTHPSLQSPLPSAPLEFTSPRTMTTSQGLEDFKRQFQQEGVNRYELRHLCTVQTVVEQWIVSSEVIKNNRVVPHVWPVSSLRNTLHIPLYVHVGM